MGDVMIVFLTLIGLICIFVVLSVCIVPQQEAFVVERLGKYHQTLNAGLNFIVPFLDKVRKKIDLREIPYDIPSQICITKDNTQITVDGIIYIKITDAHDAVYGTNNYIYAVTNLAQTTLRSVIGTMDLEETFEKREQINQSVVSSLNEAAISWGVKLLRYEIKDLTPPVNILKAMEEQITAEREKRSIIIRSEAEKIEKINLADGEKQAKISQAKGEAESVKCLAEGEKQAKINQAQGEAESIRLIAEATKMSLLNVANALEQNGGMEAANLKIAEQYIEAFKNLAGKNNTMIIPSNLTDVAGTIGTVMQTIKTTNLNQKNNDE